VYTIAEGKFPKKPGYGNLLEACRKDFRNFKDNFNNEVKTFLDKPYNGLNQARRNFLLLNNKVESIEEIGKLIRDNKEEVAFSMFFRTFPSCLPYRSKR
jgi:hypothetical protein